MPARQLVLACLGSSAFGAFAVTVHVGAVLVGRALGDALAHLTHGAL